MATCAICGTETDDIVREEQIEVRGKPYLRQVAFCPSCAVKFTFFQPLEANEAEEPPGEEKAAEEP